MRFEGPVKIKDCFEPPLCLVYLRVEDMPLSPCPIGGLCECTTSLQSFSAALPSFCLSDSGRICAFGAGLEDQSLRQSVTGGNYTGRQRALKASSQTSPPLADIPRELRSSSHKNCSNREPRHWISRLRRHLSQVAAVSRF